MSNFKTIATHAGQEPDSTRPVLETRLAALDGETPGFAFATGTAAELTALMMFEPGDTVLATTRPL